MSGSRNKINFLREIQLENEKLMKANLKILLEELIEAYEKINSFNINIKEHQRRNYSDGSHNLWSTLIAKNNALENSFGLK